MEVKTSRKSKLMLDCQAGANERKDPMETEIESEEMRPSVL